MNEATPDSPLFYISRNYVEFGTFTAAEIAAFQQRGIVREDDYVRADNTPDWIPIGNWIAELPETSRPAKAVKKPATRKRSTATKTAKKAA